LWHNRQTDARLVLRLKLRNRRGDFEGQIIKPELSILRHKPENPPPPWFGSSTMKPTGRFEIKPGEAVATSFKVKLKKIVAASFEVKPSETVTTDFEDKPVETVAAGFEDKPRETVATGFETKPVKIVQVILRPKHSQTIDLGFKAQSRNPCSSSPRARCRPHTAPPDFSTVRPPST
jgi:hypothetical protein